MRKMFVLSDDRHKTDTDNYVAVAKDQKEALQKIYAFIEEEYGKDEVERLKKAIGKGNKLIRFEPVESDVILLTESLG